MSLKKELKRKTTHLASIIIAVMFYYLGRAFTLTFLTLLLILLIEIDYFRVEWGKTLPFFKDVYRKKEKRNLSGSVFFVLGALIAISVFSKYVAITAILMTTFGDTAAALVGKKYGKTWLPLLKKRSMEGILAEFIVDFFIAYFLLENLIVILVMAITATIVETLVDRLDDNLIIPVFAGFNGQLALFLIAVL